MSSAGTPLEGDLRDVLIDHRGIENAISSSQLAEEVGIADTNGNPTTRFGIRSMIGKTGLCIGSCNEGYFVIERRGELQAYIDRLEQRKAGIDERIRMVKEAFEDDSKQQRITEVHNE